MSNPIVLKCVGGSNRTVDQVMSMWFNDADNRQIVMITHVSRTSSSPFDYIFIVTKEVSFDGCDYYSWNGFVSGWGLL